MLATDRLDLLDLCGVEIRVADIAHLPCAHELVQRTERLLERRDVVGGVVLVEIDDVGAQPLQRSIDRLVDVRARAACFGSVTHVLPELRCEHDPVTPALEHLSEQRLAAALIAVDIGGVEERDAGVESCVDDRARPFEIDDPPEVVAAQADHRDIRPFRSQPPRPHGRPC